MFALNCGFYVGAMLRGTAGLWMKQAKEHHEPNRKAAAYTPTLWLQLAVH